jgi:hypothetical protein
MMEHVTELSAQGSAGQVSGAERHGQQSQQRKSRSLNAPFHSNVNVDEPDNEEEEPDYDSDILTDSDEDADSDDDDDDEAGNDDGEEGEKDGWEFDETYVNFLNSVLFDEELLDDDDDDAEDYKPDDLKEDEELDDDEIYHEGTGRLGKHELMELMDGCLQTIAGEAPAQQSVGVLGDIGERAATVPKSPAKVSSSSKQDAPRVAFSRIDQAEMEADTEAEPWQTCPSMSLMGFPENSSADQYYQDDDVSEALGHRMDASQQVDDVPVSQLDGKVTRVPSDNKRQGNAMSRIVSQMFTEERPEVCIDGMPVEVVRKLAARQMSMASQLLLQMMLVSAEDSECHTQCIHWISDLAANRDMSVKKATLMSVSMKPILKTKVSVGSHGSNYHESDSTARDGSIFPRPSNSGADAEADANDVGTIDESSNISIAESYNARITRGVMKRTFGGPHRTTTTYSVLDLPLISKLGESISLVQRARHDSASAIKQSLERSFTYSGSLSNLDRQDSYSTAMTSLQNQIAGLCQRTGMRYWSCLVPSCNYPLNQEFMDRAFNGDTCGGDSGTLPRYRRTIESFSSTLSRYGTFAKAAL